ncbi:hypothetical protein M9H77_19236 [Catharanthus roseus]|uniref:Uncharacterized protein n=1 Tax=Catharanthus roseus TaxID=4058 RepID=A0ACC0BA14_CATRO|nr:hypothetical protein M9H77_19236 [Catharanthus roseus]
MGLWIWKSAATMFLLLSVAITIITSASAATFMSGNETDYLALIELKRQISDDPHGFLNSWNNSIHHCQWQGVTCDARNQRVTTLTLQGQSLFGSISPYLGNLSFLKTIELGENRFFGEIPPEIGRLFGLINLNLSENALVGYVPANLTQCSELVYISLRDNKFIGEILKEFGSLKKLVFLNLGGNNFTGNIPSSLGNLSLLNTLSLGVNNLEGHLPEEFGKLINLASFSVSQNFLAGNFPMTLFNISTLQNISITQNFFQGNLPDDIGLKMPNLQLFYVCANQFSGTIPNSITNATKLEIICLSTNKFQGELPKNIGNYLPNLQVLAIGTNLLEGDLTFISSLTNCSGLQILDINDNNFEGELPKSIGNLSSNLQQLMLDFNKISGEIPLELGNLRNLILLSMNSNSISGTIPSNFGAFQSLQRLKLATNKLSGSIPSVIYNITSLYSLKLEQNFFEGTIPLSLGTCRSLLELDLSQNKLTGNMNETIFASSFSPLFLDLSYNSLTGSLPIEVGNLKQMSTFNVSYNNFRGEIPTTIGECSSLEYLSMEGNSFRGLIPPTLASIKGIQYLDLSQNQLTGEIPKDLESLVFLKYMNLSFNDLEGEVPFDGVFGNASLISLEGNNKLCGGINELGLHSCMVRKKKNRKMLIIILLPIFLTMILSFALLLLVYRRRLRRKWQSIVHQRDDKIINVSFYELHRATGGFSQENLIGSGGFGFVYKGVLDQHGGRIVAIKVLDLRKNGASTSFKAECRALRNIRHRNLVSLITYCSSIDKEGQEFKALVYEFMQNGSLDGWLHPGQLHETEKPRNLSLVQRINIAIDVAMAMDYLHNQTHVPIVHCDLKPSNILLDSDLTAHVGDFGLARLLLTSTENSSAQGISSNTIAVKGSIGYAAPEYGIGGEPSTAGDVYSYGILLLEIFTERRPTDDIFKDGLDLHNFVLDKMNFPKQVMMIFHHASLDKETRILNEPDDLIEIGVSTNSGDLMECFISILRIGLKCSVTLPKDRMNMNEVGRELLHIKNALFGLRRHAL